MKKFSILIVSALLAFAGLSASAATYTNLVGDGVGFADRNAGRVYTIETSLNVADQALGTGDVVQVIAFPANSYVLAVQAEVITAAHTNLDSSNQTFTIGDGSDADGWIKALSGIAVGDASSQPVTASLTNTTGVALTTTSPAYGTGKYYTSADTLDLTTTGVFTDGVFRVRANVIDFTR